MIDLVNKDKVFLIVLRNSFERIYIVKSTQYKMNSNIYIADGTDLSRSQNSYLYSASGHRNETHFHTSCVSGEAGGQPRVFDSLLFSRGFASRAMVAEALRPQAWYGTEYTRLVNYAIPINDLHGL